MLYGTMTRSAIDFLATDCKKLVAVLQTELSNASAALSKAEVEAAKWATIQGTPRVEAATKKRHIDSHAEYWRQQVNELKGKISEYQTDIAGLQLLA